MSDEHHHQPTKTKTFPKQKITESTPQHLPIRESWVNKALISPMTPKQKIEDFMEALELNAKYFPSKAEFYKGRSSYNKNTFSSQTGNSPIVQYYAGMSQGRTCMQSNIDNVTGFSLEDQLKIPNAYKSNNNTNTIINRDSNVSQGSQNYNFSPSNIFNKKSSNCNTPLMFLNSANSPMMPLVGGNLYTSGKHLSLNDKFGDNFVITDSEDEEGNNCVIDGDDKELNLKNSEKDMYRLSFISEDEERKGQESGKEKDEEGNNNSRQQEEDEQCRNSCFRNDKMNGEDGVEEGNGKDRGYMDKKGSEVGMHMPIQSAIHKAMEKGIRISPKGKKKVINLNLMKEIANKAEEKEKEKEDNNTNKKEEYMEGLQLQQDDTKEKEKEKVLEIKEVLTVDDDKDKQRKQDTPTTTDNNKNNNSNNNTTVNKDINNNELAHSEFNLNSIDDTSSSCSSFPNINLNFINPYIPKNLSTSTITTITQNTNPQQQSTPSSSSSQTQFPPTQQQLIPSSSTNNTAQSKKKLKKIKRLDPSFYTNIPIEQLAPNIFQLAKDQGGCRYLQKLLDDDPQTTSQILYQPLIENILRLVNDPFGNYFIQKMFANLSADQIHQIIFILSPHIFDIGANPHGTRVLQHLISFLSTPTLIEYFLSVMSPHIVPLLKELNGTHVVQKFAFEYPTYAPYVNKVIIDNSPSLATHRHGCCVIQKYLETSQGEMLRLLLEKLINNCLMLIVDQFGNYVIQSILLMKKIEYGNAIAMRITENVCYYAKHKYSSNVVEKCFDYCDGVIRQKLIYTLLRPEAINDLILDEHGNYVIQKVLACVEPETQKMMLMQIVPLFDKLRMLPFGERIINRLVMSYPQLTSCFPYQMQAQQMFMAMNMMRNGGMFMMNNMMMGMPVMQSMPALQQLNNMNDSNSTGNNNNNSNNNSNGNCTNNNSGGNVGLNTNNNINSINTPNNNSNTTNETNN